MTGRYMKVAGLLLALGLFAAACGGGGEQAGGGGNGQPTQGGEFSAYDCEPEALVPINANESCSAEVLYALFSQLVDYDLDTAQPIMGDDAPRAHAESIESDDQQRWTIRLKEGWTFHDGTPVTAQSYVDTWNYAAYQPNAQDNAYFFQNIEGYDDLQCPDQTCSTPPPTKEMSGLRAIDETTIEVLLSAPFSQYPLTLGYTAFYPLPEAFFADPEQFNEAPIGNGPFMMDGVWNHNQSIRVVRYEDYAGQPANAEAVTFQIYDNVETAYTDLQAGNLDIMDRLPRSQIPVAEQEFGDRFEQFPGSGWTYLGFPLYDPRFQNPDLRKAFSMAINREALTETVRPDSVPSDGFISPVVAGYREGVCGEACEYNPEEARRLLEQAGGWEGELVLWYNSDGDHQTWMEGLANQLRQNLGIEQIRFETLIFAEYNTVLDNNGMTGPFRLAWLMDYPSPQNYLEQIFATGASSNRTTYSDPEFDRLVAQGNAAGSIEDGLEFYQQAAEILAEDLPVAPLFFDRFPTAWTERLSGVDVDPFERMNTADIIVNG